MNLPNKILALREQAAVLSDEAAAARYEIRPGDPVETQMAATDLWLTAHAGAHAAQEKFEGALRSIALTA